MGTLMNQNRVSPIEDPFDYLWIANCVLFFVVVAFLLLKGWKKHKSGQPTITRTKVADKWKIAYGKKVIETRSKIAIAKAEMERFGQERLSTLILYAATTRERKSQMQRLRKK